MTYLGSKLKKLKNKNQYLNKHCADAAQAIQEKYGGEPYIIGEFPSQKFWHIVIKRNGKYWDVNGPHTKKELNKKYKGLQMRQATANDKKQIKKQVNKKIVQELRKKI
jgi:hypothetical protein